MKSSDKGATLNNTIDIRKELVAAQERLFGYALHLSANEDDARDLLQDTSLRILGSVDKYSHSGLFSAWAGVVMKNLFNNGCRGSEARKKEFFDGYDPLSDAHTAPFVADSACPYDSEIYDIIASLPPVQARLLMLRASGYHYDEIATRFNLPLGSVKSSLFAARKHLRQILEDEWGYKF